VKEITSQKTRVMFSETEGQWQKNAALFATYKVSQNGIERLSRGIIVGPTVLSIPTRFQRTASAEFNKAFLLLARLEACPNYET
jgi:hypothetical protein